MDRSPPASRARIDFALLLLCFLVSGVAGLVYQTAWTQQFTLVFGASELAVVAVLAAYMTGLTLGAWVVKHVALAVRRPVAVYALLELGIALAALLVPYALGLARTVQVALLGGRDLAHSASSPAVTLFHFCAAFAILIVPTGLMGATLPILVRHLVRVEAEIGPRAAALYTVNTFGAAAGAFLGAFVLLPTVGLGRTVLGGALFNLLACVLALPLARGGRTEPLPATAAAELLPRTSWILPVMLLSGAVSFTYEVLWTRLLTFPLGGSIYAFATMLATFLCGIALGAAAVTPFARERESARVAFVLAQIGAASCSLGAFLALEHLRLPTTTPGAGLDAALLGLLAATLLPGAVCIGATFPLAVRILAVDAASAGPASARVYAWNTIGAVAGAIVAGFWLLPALRFAGALSAAVATGLVLAALAALVPPRRTTLAALAALGLVVLVLVRPATPWRILRSSPVMPEQRGEIRYYGVGKSATVLVQDLGWEWRISSNGLPESAIQPPGARPARYAIAHWLLLLPVAARPEMRTAFVVGLGAGQTVEDIPRSLVSVDVAELEPEIVEANRALAGRRRRDPLAEPRVRLHIDDARSVLLLGNARFDAVISQPSHPWTAGAAHLFTREFFRLVESRLEPDGVFVQWISTYFLDDELLRTLIATLLDVFPEVEVYAPPPGESLLFLAAREPLAVERTSAASLAAEPELWASLGVLVPQDLALSRVLDAEGARSVSHGAPLNTDARNLLQTRSPHILANPVEDPDRERLFGPHDPLLRADGTQADLYAVRRLVQTGRGARGARARRIAANLQGEGEREIAEALIAAAAPRARERARELLWDAWRRWPERTELLHALLIHEADALVAGQAPSELAAAVERDPVAAAVLEGWRLYRTRQTVGIRELDDRLAGLAPTHPLFESAERLRAVGRLASEEPALAREGLALLEPLLARSAAPRDLLLRAELGALAQDADVALASLAEIVERSAKAGATAPELVNKALRVLEALPADPEDERRELLRFQLSELPRTAADEE